jgi:hypothetical protein
LHLLPATIDTRLSELINEQVAKTDYRIKVQVKQFWDVLAQMQALRRGLPGAQQNTPK